MLTYKINRMGNGKREMECDCERRKKELRKTTAEFTANGLKNE